MGYNIFIYKSLSNKDKVKTLYNLERRDEEVLPIRIGLDGMESLPKLSHVETDFFYFTV